MSESIHQESAINLPFIDDGLAGGNKFTELVEEEIIPLLEEKLIVNHTKQRIGEVIVRKQITTQMIEIPVRRERLIVEQISPTHRQLAEIDLKTGDREDIQLISKELPDNGHLHQGLLVCGQFISPKVASLILNAIALEQDHGCQQVQVIIAVENESQRQRYQEWFNRCSHS
ncbi:hypothetical protein B6N60_02558 [Richelia sinica FACHB-800]|uniref:DUF2382 domain-containing protein n=1 Tax=Richelia sinica FACHB-800 TaxID=1357546 RepID=A0A975Y554_9NOST|nr:DUF2382 domain-containing protein [Richelia sinica]MBD2666252.1 DUF2382 domain-containing protein [Richelia sinica FACHB-800]QXE23862.1 hypothetical protein B6N60_02558 [Richelia sinica FACHB-800]